MNPTQVKKQGLSYRLEKRVNAGDLVCRDKSDTGIKSVFEFRRIHLEVELCPKATSAQPAHHVNNSKLMSMGIRTSAPQIFLYEIEQPTRQIMLAADFSFPPFIFCSNGKNN